MKGSSITEFFMPLEDPRVARTQRHAFQSIIVIAICAIVCGADSWVAVEEYGKAKLEWFKTFLDLENDIASHDTFGRVFAALDPDKFCECFMKWIEYLAKTVLGDIISIDGKTLRKSFDKASSKAAIHMVSAWSSANQLVLGQIKTEDKSNEITAIPKLLELIVVKGAIVTIDAMGCQKKIVEKIIDKEADYVIGLKGNQGNLLEEVEDYFKYADSNNYAGITHDYYEEIDAGHGRIETRRVWSTGDIDWSEEKNKWKGLDSIVKVESTREIGDDKSVETRFYISSLDGTDAKKAHTAIRSHWGIENNLHWQLDVSFSEDQCRVREGYAAENFSTLRKIALSLLQKEKTAKCGINNKRLKAGWDERYLLKVLQI